MRRFLLILATGALMVVCGLGAFLATISYLMKLGMKYHDNYEYYGQTPAVALIFVAAAGFLAPGFVAWYMYQKNPVIRFSLRTLLTITTLVAIVVGMVAAIWRIAN